MKPIDNLLRERLYRAQKPIIEHPPIDLLSAFSEKALSGSDHAYVLQHLAQCGDCREIIFLAAPQVISPAEQESNRQSAAPWVSWPTLRWGTLAACVVIVVAAVGLRPSHRATYPEAPTTQAKNQQTSQEPVTKQLGQKAVPIVSAVAESHEPSPVRMFHGPTGKAKAVPEMVSLPSGDSFEEQMARLAYVPTDNRMPPPRWTLAEDGSLRRSLDGGISWKRIHVGGDHLFRTVAAAGRSVWLGGKNGVLFHSSDAGQHWTQLKRTAGRPMPDSDIIAIEFEDELHGKLITATNESWTTADAGRSWEKQ